MQPLLPSYMLVMVFTQILCIQQKSKEICETDTPDKAIVVVLDVMSIVPVKELIGIRFFASLWCITNGLTSSLARALSNC